MQQHGRRQGGGQERAIAPLNFHKLLLNLPNLKNSSIFRSEYWTCSYWAPLQKFPADTLVQQCVCSTICLCAVNLSVCTVSETCVHAHMPTA